MSNIKLTNIKVNKACPFKHMHSCNGANCSKVCKMDIILSYKLIYIYIYSIYCTVPQVTDYVTVGPVNLTATEQGCVRKLIGHWQE